MTMRPLHHTIPIDEARAILAAAARPVTRLEPVELSGLAHRVLAEAIVADADVPAFTRAMMDGYAVRAADTADASPEAPRQLAVTGRVFTGETFPGALEPGGCIEIATGAPLPAGADAVVMVEDTRAIDGTRVAVTAGVQPGQHVGRQGADVARGSTVLGAGDVLLPGRVGLLAALGRTSAVVLARPRVAIVSTGNEVVVPGRPLGPGQIYDINRYALAAVVADHGGTPVPLDVAGDTLEALDRAVDEAAAACDVIVFSGGSSVGDRDLVLDVLRRRGRVAFHGIATRPGKPTAFGDIGGTPVFGMPGNPASCLTNAYVLLAPFLRRVAGLPPHRPHVVTAPLARRVTSSAGRHQFYTVRLVAGRAEPAFKASGDITSLAHADGYVEIASEVTVLEAGTLVDVVCF